MREFRSSPETAGGADSVAPLPLPFHCPRSGFHAFQCTLPSVPRHSSHSCSFSPPVSLPRPSRNLSARRAHRPSYFLPLTSYFVILPPNPRHPRNRFTAAPRTRFPVQINFPSTTLSFLHAFRPYPLLVFHASNLTNAARQPRKTNSDLSDAAANASAMLPNGYSHGIPTTRAAMDAPCPGSPVATRTMDIFPIPARRSFARP